MSDNGTGYVARTEFEFFRNEFHEHRAESNSRFEALGSKMDDFGRAMGERFDRIIEAQSNNRGDVTKYGTIIAVIAAVMTSIIGGFVTLENNSINSTITAQGANQAKDIARVEAQVSNVVATTVPRPELEYRVNGNRDAIEGLTKTQDAHDKSIASIGANLQNVSQDVERLKSNIVPRDENRTHWEDYENRLNLLSNRVTELAKETGGGAVSEQVRELRDQVNDFQRKFIAVPAFPKYNDR